MKGLADVALILVNRDEALHASPERRGCADVGLSACELGTSFKSTLSQLGRRLLVAFWADFGMNLSKFRAFFILVAWPFSLVLLLRETFILVLTGANLGPAMEQFWTIFGPSSEGSGQSLGQVWTNFEQNLDRLGPDFGRLWANFEPSLS